MIPVSLAPARVLARVASLRYYYYVGRFLDSQDRWVRPPGGSSAPCGRARGARLFTHGYSMTACIWLNFDLVGYHQACPFAVKHSKLSQKSLPPGPKNGQFVSRHHDQVSDSEELRGCANALPKYRRYRSVRPSVGAVSGPIGHVHQ